MTFERLVAITVALIVIAILLATAMLGLLLGRWEEARGEPLRCIDNVEARDRIRTLVLEGLDNGLRDQAAHLVTTWARDPQQQPRRAQAGIQNIVAAYLEGRSLALKWDVPICNP